MQEIGAKRNWLTGRDSVLAISAQERMRLYRMRRRNGLRSVQVLLHETEIDSLISKGFLKPGRRHNHAAVERAGTSCQSPAIRGRRRCRLHGGLSPGAPKGSQNGNYKNGEWTAEAIEERKWLRDLVRSFGKPGQHHD